MARTAPRWLVAIGWQVAAYMADARDLALPLGGGGDHDWNGLARIAGATRAIGPLIMLLGLAWSGWFALPAGD